MRDQLGMLTIETAHHPQMRPARFDLGSRLPIETSAMGRAYLFALAEDEREALLRRIRLQWPRSEWRGVRVFVVPPARSGRAAVGDPANRVSA